MSTRWQTFTPLALLPYEFVERVQDCIFTHRGTGTANTLAPTLDSSSTQVSTREIVVSLDSPASGMAALQLDTGFDWRDRNIHCVLRFDPLRDIRPGEGNDDAFPMIRTSSDFYTRLGGETLVLAPHLALYIDPANGALLCIKAVGWAHLTVEGRCQLKERS